MPKIERERLHALSTSRRPSVLFFFYFSFLFFAAFLSRFSRGHEHELPVAHRR